MSQSSSRPKARLLTKSRFMKASECPRKLFYTQKPEYADRKLDDGFLKALARGGFQVGRLAQEYEAPGYEITEKDYDKAFTETQKHLLNDEVTLFEASIRYKNHYVKVDVLKKNGKTLELIEVKAKSYDGQEFFTKKGELYQNKMTHYLYDVAYQTWVLQKAFPDYHILPFLYLVDKNKMSPIEGLNQKFKILRDGTIKTEPLSAEVLHEKLLKLVDVREPVKAIHESRDRKEVLSERNNQTYSEWVQGLSDLYEKDQKASIQIKKECKSCEYRVDPRDYPDQKSGFEECWKDAGLDPSVAKPKSFDLWYAPTRKFIDKKIFYLEDLTEEDITAEKTRNFEETNPFGGMTNLERKLLQIQKARVSDSKPFLHPDIQDAMDLPKPFHFIDFETAMVAIPFNKGRRPYEQIAFQFSHHLMDENGKIEHKTQWINTDPGFFPNFEFVRQLKKALSNDQGTIFRYASHENTVLNQILKQLHNSEEKDKHELIAWLKTFISPTSENEFLFGKWVPKREFVDLLQYVIWFYYHPQMGGSNSLKAVLPAILNSSDYLKEKYSKEIYEKDKAVKSLNYDKKTWVILENGVVRDPYHDLGPIFPDISLTRESLDDAFGEGDDSELRDGGAAMMGYCRLQFSDLSKDQRSCIESALLRYCELDTLAMVMLWEAWRNTINK